MAPEKEWIQVQPALGLATTRELLQEIKARGETETGYYAALGRYMALEAERLMDELPGSMLDYTTVNGYDDD